MNYSPKKVIIFEPFEDCRNQLITVLNKNSVDAEKYDIQPVGLSERTEIFSNMQCHTLDSISQKYATQFGVLKADIEGMGLKFVKGAEQTIKRDRPLLSLSIYHNADEFAGIYQTLKSWDLGYHFEIKFFSPLVPYGELSLFGYPQEWIK